jgi:hypothetical protein
MALALKDNSVVMHPEVWFIVDNNASMPRRPRITSHTHKGQQSWALSQRGSTTCGIDLFGSAALVGGSATVVTVTGENDLMNDRRKRRSAWIQEAHSLFPGARGLTREEKKLYQKAIAKIAKPTGRRLFDR